MAIDERRILDTGEADPPDAVERIVREFRNGFAAVARIDRPAVALFGSARVGEGRARLGDRHRPRPGRDGGRWTGCGPARSRTG